jgi:hypothetical protein
VKLPARPRRTPPRRDIDKGRSRDAGPVSTGQKRTLFQEARTGRRQFLLVVFACRTERSVPFRYCRTCLRPGDPHRPQKRKPRGERRFRTGRWHGARHRAQPLRVTMYFLAVATDYDGTIAHHGSVKAETVAALKRCKESGRRLILVTGRELPDLKRAFPESNSLIAWWPRMAR